MLHCDNINAEQIFVKVYSVIGFTLRTDRKIPASISNFTAGVFGSSQSIEQGRKQNGGKKTLQRRF